MNVEPTPGQRLAVLFLKNYFMKKSLLFVLLCFILTACKDDPCSKPLPEGDIFIFSKYYCECMGSCITGYKLTDQGLFQGAGTWCDPATLTFSATPLSDDKANLAQTLRYAIPAQMLDTDEEVYGCPDCGDWGGYYIELTSGGTTKSWRLDTHKDGLPADIKAYVEMLEQTLADLQ